MFELLEGAKIWYIDLSDYTKVPLVFYTLTLFVFISLAIDNVDKLVLLTIISNYILITFTNIDKPAFTFFYEIESKL